jgi:D-glycero-alpha-D-manno-heptose-7-phosphate kinase
VRTADVGGWTDTWFAESGLVCNVAIDQRASVVVEHDPTGPNEATLMVRYAGHRDTFEPGAGPGRHPILESAIALLAPRGRTLVDIAASNDPGSGLGSSAAVMVALVGGLRSLQHDDLDLPAIVALAHRAEISTGKESGVQDHVAAAYGGISRIEIDYPSSWRVAVDVPATAVEEFGQRLHTVSFGLPHVSGPMHEQVIARLAQRSDSTELDAMRDAAYLAIVALEVGDLDAYGAAMLRNHEAMRDLHPALVSFEADEVIELARRFGARGWKVNGAGGDGGSIAVLGPADPELDDALVAEIDAHERWRVLDETIGAPGLRVDELEPHGVW